MRQGVFAAILVVSATVSGHGQEPAELGKFKLDDETFRVATYGDCCFEVSFLDQKGYMGVWANGTPEGPYAWWIGDGSPPVTSQGVTCCNVDRTLKSVLDGLCKALVRQHNLSLGRARGSTGNPRVASSKTTSSPLRKATALNRRPASALGLLAVPAFTVLPTASRARGWAP